MKIEKLFKDPKDLIKLITLTSKTNPSIENETYFIAYDILYSLRLALLNRLAPGINCSKQEALNITEFTGELPEIDCRIELKSKKEEDYIKDCFMLLVTEGKSILSSADVMYILQSSFTNYGEKLPHKKFAMPMDITHLSFFMRRVAVGLRGEEDLDTKDKEIFRNVLISNFEEFADVKPATVVTYFGRNPAKFPPELKRTIDNLSKRYLYPYR